MKTPKIWCCLCSLFLLYAIIMLSREAQEIVFSPVHNSSESYNYSVCVDLKSKLFVNKTQLDLDEFADELYLYFKKKGQNNTSETFHKLLNSVRQRNYFFFKDHFCFLEDKKELFYISSFLDGNRNYFIFKQSSYDLFRLTKNTESADADQSVVIYKEWPFSNCLKNYSKFRCLTRCSKERHRISRYYFDGSEKGVIHLTYDYNETIKATEYMCLDHCRFDDCKVSAFEESFDLKNKKTSVYEAKFMISEFNYWTQLLGLLALHLSISFYQLLSKLIEFVSLKLEKKFGRFKKKVNLCRNFCKIAILLIIGGCSLHQGIEMVTHFRRKAHNITGEEMRTYLFEPEPFSLGLCLLMDYFNKFDGKQFYSVKNVSLLELERMSDRLIDEQPIVIYLQFEEQRFEVNWVLTPRVFFKTKGNALSEIFRCFKIDVRPSEPAYQSLLSASKLIVKLKPDQKAKLYLLPEDQNFNSKSLEFTSGKYWKKIVKGSKCVDYGRKGCGSRVDCLERCINRKLFEKHGRINSLLVVDKDQFSKKIWQSSYLSEDFDDYKEIERKCSEKYANEGCNEISFESTGTAVRIRDINEIDLFYNVITVLKSDPSIYSLVIDILNIQSLALGLNLFKLLMMIYGLAAAKFRFAKSKLHLLFIYLLVLPGFVYHLYSLFDGVLHGELVHHISYLLLNTVQQPEIIFCVNYNQTKIDRNHKLTRNYLDQVTEEDDLKIENVFDKFVYLNEINEWVTSRASVVGDKPEQLQVTTFYLATRKCFRIKLEVRYKMLQFNFAEDKKVLKVFFGREFARRKREVLFFTKTRNAIQFSKLNTFVIHQNHEDFKSKNRFTIFQNHLFRSINDKFFSLKHPLFYGCDHGQDLLQLNSEFEWNFRLSTLKLPVEDLSGDLPVDDEAFDQFNKQLHNTTNCGAKSQAIIERRFVTTLVKEKHLSGFNVSFSERSDFDFHLNFLVQSIKVTNEDNVVKLLISILNVLSLWLDQGVLDLPARFCKINTLFTALHRSTKKMKHMIKRTLLNESD